MNILSLSLCLNLLAVSVPYHHTITRIACKNNVDPRLVASIIKVESNFKPKALLKDPYHGNSMGLMQLKYSTARWMGMKGSPNKLYIPYVNIYYGVHYIKYLMIRYHGNIGAVISAYNAGSARWNRQTGYKNKIYVRKVYRNYLNYKRGGINVKK